MKQARLSDYITWLEGYLAKGYKPTHTYLYNWPARDFLIATEDFYLGDECGASSRSIIVPKGINWLGGARGHNNLYYMEDFKVEGHFVPLYLDKAFRSLKFSKGSVQKCILEEIREEVIFRLEDWIDEDDFEDTYAKVAAEPISALLNKGSEEYRMRIKIKAIEEIRKAERATDKDIDKLLRM